MARSFASASAQYLRTTALPNAALPITISAWFYSTTTSGFQTVAYYGESSNSQVACKIGLGYPSAGAIYNQVYREAINALPVKSTYSINTWHHACAVSDTTAARIYLDGVASSDSTYSTPSFTSSTYGDVGRTPNVSDQYLNGRVAYLGIWSAALNAAEAEALAAGYHPRLVRPGSLLGCWDFGGFSGEHDKDFVGGYNLTAYNSPTWVDSPRIIWPDDDGDVVMAAGSTAKPWLYSRRGARMIGGGLS